jgi:hypothetical protein
MLHCSQDFEVVDGIGRMAHRRWEVGYQASVVCFALYRKSTNPGYCQSAVKLLWALFDKLLRGPDLSAGFGEDGLSVV